MENESLFLTRDCLAELAADRSLANVQLGCRGGRGLLRIHANPGSQPGLSTDVAVRPIELVFDPERIEVSWSDRMGARCRAWFDRDENGQDLASLVNDPLNLPHLAVTLSRDQPALAGNGVSVEGPAFGADSLRMLLRHAAVADLLFGSDGHEVSLQFQVGRGFAGVDQRPPNDWVGIDFTETTGDLSWFDQNGLFQIRSYVLPEDADLFRACLADPLGHVARAAAGKSENHDASGISGLMERLQRSFTSIG